MSRRDLGERVAALEELGVELMGRIGKLEPPPSDPPGTASRSTSGPAPISSSPSGTRSHGPSMTRLETFGWIVGGVVIGAVGGLILWWGVR